jgi:hypothetical protein
MDFETWWQAAWAWGNYCAAWPPRFPTCDWFWLVADVLFTGVLALPFVLMLRRHLLTRRLLREHALWEAQQVEVDRVAIEDSKWVG